MTARLSATLREGLQSYTLGEKLRGLRLRKKMGLVELGRHTGLSPGLLSKLERGKMIPTLPTLLRIALVFSVGLEYFFSDPASRHTVAVVRKRDRKRFPEKMGKRRPAYQFESLDFPAVERRLNAYYAEFQPGEEARAEPHTHDGVEFLYLMSGKLELEIGNEKKVLSAGDSIYFDSVLPHSYRRVGRQPCTALVVTVP